MTYIDRAKDVVQAINRFDASMPSNPQLIEIAQAFVYNPALLGKWNRILEQNSLVVNPANPEILDDIGTLSGEEGEEIFTPSSAGTINSMYALQYIRGLRKFSSDSLWSYRRRISTTNAPAVPLKDVQDTARATSDTDAQVIVGDDEDDPES